MTRSKTRLTLASLTVTLILAGALLSTATASSSTGKALSGTLALTAGKQVKTHGKTTYTGTYFRMIEPGGTDKYFSNPSSRATDQTYTLLRPGTESGLELGKFQPGPNPAFSSSGGALAKEITRPTPFASINFSISTAATDAQSARKVPAPSLDLIGSKITGNLSAWTAEWNKIYFNQGAPKPGGTFPGETQPVTGTYDKKTKAFTIIWYSAIIGGPFSGFTGYWHLQGKLKG
jgi:hypothetical protein